LQHKGKKQKTQQHWAQPNLIRRQFVDDKRDVVVFIVRASGSNEAENWHGKWVRWCDGSCGRVKMSREYVGGSGKRNSFLKICFKFLVFFIWTIVHGMACVMHIGAHDKGSTVDMVKHPSVPLSLFPWEASTLLKSDV